MGGYDKPCIIGLGLACIAEIDEDGAAPNGPTGFHIAGTIANHVAVRQRNSKLIRGLQKHSGLWLAAIAGFLGGVAAHLDGIDRQRAAVDEARPTHRSGSGLGSPRVDCSRRWRCHLFNSRRHTPGTEDISIACSIPNLTVIASCEPAEAKAAARWCATHERGLVYPRQARRAS